MARTTRGPVPHRRTGEVLQLSSTRSPVEVGRLEDLGHLAADVGGRK